MNKITKHLFTILRICLAIGLLYYLGTSGSINWPSLTGLAKAWEITFGAIALFLLATVMQAWRLQILINAYHLNLSFFSSIRLTFIGLFFNTYLPGATGGDLAKIYYASKGNPGSRTEVITILLIDRFIGLFSLLILPLLLTPFFLPVIESKNVLRGLLVTSFIISIGILVFALLISRLNLEKSRILDFIEKRVVFGNRIRRVIHTLHSYSNKKSIIFNMILLSIVSHLMMVCVSLLISQATNPAGADHKMLILIPLAYLANSLPVTPGGLGVGEAALEALFNMFSLQGGAEVILGWRMIMIIVGLIGLAFYLRGEKRFVFSSEVQDK